MQAQWMAPPPGMPMQQQQVQQQQMQQQQMQQQRMQQQRMQVQLRTPPMPWPQEQRRQKPPSNSSNRRGEEADPLLSVFIQGEEQQGRKPDIVGRGLTSEPAAAYSSPAGPAPRPVVKRNPATQFVPRQRTNRTSAAPVKLAAAKRPRDAGPEAEVAARVRGIAPAQAVQRKKVADPMAAWQ